MYYIAKFSAIWLIGWLLTQQLSGAAPAPVGKPTILQFEPEMVHIPAGSFAMGSPTSEEGHSADEEPVHVVHVNAFKIGKYEVTQEQWQKVMGTNPSSFSSCGKHCPVEQTSWHHVQIYIAKLNARTGKAYRLPTEAEWEYACRGGVAGETYCGGNDVATLAWYAGNSDGMTHPVGSKAANGWGVFDMSGNVWEWTCSEYDSTYSGKEVTCENSGSTPRSARGAAWVSSPKWVRAAYRLNLDAFFINSFVGLRLAHD